ncbi:hypothetical protein HY949_00125 [Candidatus Gottesmanbacteria bacterium]|nr:hypothetical protein [Candidatus Gottesmanbacteria bacterium]
MSRRVFVFLVTAIFILGLALRFGRFVHVTTFSGDTARDLLVGYHIAKYGELPQVGHAASGLTPPFYYPPYYFYFLGLLNMITTNPYLLMGAAVVWQSASIVLVSLVANALYGRTAGVIAGLITAVFPYFIKQHSFIFSGPLTTPLFLGALYCLIYAVKQKNRYFAYFSLFLLVVGGSVSYALLIFLPVFLVALFLSNKTQKVGQFCLIFGWTGLLLAILFYPLVSEFGTSAILRFDPLVNIKIGFDFFDRFIAASSSIIWDFFDQRRIAIISVLIVLITVVGSQRLTFLSKKTIGLIVLILYPVTLFSLKRGIAEFYYLNTVYHFFPIVLGCFIVQAYQLAKGWPKPVAIAVGATLILSGSSGMPYYLKESYNDFAGTRDIAGRIIRIVQDIKETNNLSRLDFFRAYYYEPLYGDWSSPRLWYFLERLSGEKLVIVSNDYNNLRQVNTDELVFVYCVYSWKNISDDVCKQDFLGRSPTHFFVADLGTSLYLFRRQDSGLRIPIKL